MTEVEWLASDDPAAMLQAITNARPNDPERQGYRYPCVTDRKLRLFACACCRAVWDGSVCPVTWDDEEPSMFPAIHPKVCECRGTGRVGGLTDPRSRAAVEVAERYADGLATKEEFDELSMATITGCCRPTALSAAQTVIAEQRGSPAAQAALLRDIVGNPWRPVIDPKVPQPQWHPILAWNNGIVPSLAQRAYDDRCPADALAVLADALEEAGYTEEALLRHLRGQEPVLREVPRQTQVVAPPVFRLVGWRPLRGPHARGCWALDLILGRE